jgi:uncharacterized iron-regulated membrane protein
LFSNPNKTRQSTSSIHRNILIRTIKNYNVALPSFLSAKYSGIGGCGIVPLPQFAWMTSIQTPRLRRFQRVWRNVHLCIGAGLLLLLGSIALSGALLVWKTPIDAMLHSARYATTLGVAKAPSAYVSRVIETGFEPINIQFGENGGPIDVTARRESGENGARPNFVAVYLDPPTNRVLDVVDIRTSLFGLLHRFHENLTIPEYNGRAIVGWTGVAMLISVLTGIYLWWSRGGGIKRGLRWRRGTGVLSNLHHTIGIWIALPLAVVALSGIYLGFPQQGRTLVSAFFIMAPAERGAFSSPLVKPTARSIDAALEAARVALPGAQPSSISLPTKQLPVWRVELRQPGTNETSVLTVDDASGAVKGSALAGDRVATWIRSIHQGSRGGPVWRTLVFLCDLFPPILGLSGVIIWLQQRRLRR